MDLAQHGQLLGQLRQGSLARDVKGQSGVLEYRGYPVRLLGWFAIHHRIPAFGSLTNKLLRAYFSS